VIADPCMTDQPTDGTFRSAGALAKDKRKD
jgi:hypothetical protein